MRLCLALLLLWTPQDKTATVSGRITAPETAVQKRLRTKLYTDASVERKDPDPTLAVVWIEGAPAAKVEPKTAALRQEGLEFRPRAVAVGVGSKVEFPNEDDLFHNVFSYSKVQRVEGGSYGKGETKVVVMERKGLIDIRCDVHKHMRAYIHVFDHPYFTVAAADGSYSIPNVPPGKYTIVAWKEFFEPVRQEIVVEAGGTKKDLPMAAFLDRPADRTVGTACCDAR